MHFDKEPPQPPENDPSLETLDQSLPGSPEISLPRRRDVQLSEEFTAFSPGDLVAKRFRIERFLAQGGMGEVYEALDLELKQKVALKTVRSVLLVDAHALERFRQEIVVAKRITHPNICRTYDLFRHESTKPGEPDVLVVSMELLSGKTLDRLLKEKGKLSTSEALPLVKQMVVALSAAHQERVVHRDFKSNNVMLVPPPPDASATRVVVTDFGLAHSLEPGDGALTRPGEVIGTPAYMSPEQVNGAEITPASDIYSLGIVMFEMLTGKLPFEGKNWKELAFKRLEQPAPNPKSFEPALDEIWAQVILKCLERQPADRFQSAEEITDAIAARVQPQLRSEAQRKRRLALISITASGLLALIATGIYIARNSGSHAKPAVGPGVTILGFKNTTGDKSLDPWGEEFATSLSAVLDVKPIRYLYPARFKNSWQPPPPSQMPDTPDSGTLSTMRSFGCDYVVVGSYSVIGNPGARQILWIIRIVNAASGETEATIPENILESDRLNIIRHAGDEVRLKLGIALTSEQKMQAERSLPANQDASTALSLGNVKMRNFEYAQARDLFEAAAQLDPTNAEIPSALAEAYWALGFENEAQKQANIALAKSDGLPDEKVFLIRARSHSYSRQWEKAAEDYSALAKVFPSRYDYTLQLASNWLEARNYPKAVETLQSINLPSVPSGVKAQRDLQLAELYSPLEKKPEERLQVINSASQEAREAGAGIIAARVEIQRCLLLLHIGQDGAEKACADAVELNSKQGDDLGTARATNAVANGYYQRNELDKAQPLYEHALAIAMRIGDKRDQAGALLNLGNIQRGKENFFEARKLYEQSIRVSLERAGVNDDLLGAKQGLALSFSDAGDLRKAIPVFQEVVTDARSIGDKKNLSDALGNLCAFLPLIGDIVTARPDCEESLQLAIESGGKTAQAQAQQSLADVLAASDSLPEAETHYLLALRAQQDLGADTDAASIQASLADLYLNKGDLPAAEKNALAALQVFLSKKGATDEVEVRCTLAQIYLDMQRLSDARQQIAEAQKRLPEVQDSAVRAGFSIQQAVVQNSPKPVDSAVSQLKKIELEMTAAGQTQLALQARLARLEALSGSQRKRELEAFANEAKQRGYRLLARKALAAAGA